MRKLSLDSVVSLDDGRVLISSIDTDVEPLLQRRCYEECPFLPFELALFDCVDLRLRLLNRLRECEDWAYLLEFMTEVSNPDAFSFDLGSRILFEKKKKKKKKKKMSCLYWFLLFVLSKV